MFKTITVGLLVLCPSVALAAIPPDLQAMFAKYDQERPDKIKNLEKHIKDLAKHVTATQRGKIVKGQNGTQLARGKKGIDVLTFSSKESKAKDLASAKEKVEKAKAKLEAVKAGEQMLFDDFNEYTMKVGNYGYLHHPDSDPGQGSKVEQVIDGKSARIWWGEIVLLSGIDTSTWRDGGKIRYTGLCKVAGNYTYTAALGNPVTILKIEPVDETAIQAHWKEYAASLPNKGKIAKSGK